MWVDSKSAASVLGVSSRAIQKACTNSKFSDKKICTIKSKILNFRYQDNSRGGLSGKVLQIWLDDELIIDAIKRGVITDGVIKAKLLSVLNMRGISCNDTPTSDKSLRDIKESSKGKSTTEFTKFSEFDIDERGEFKVKDERNDKGASFCSGKEANLSNGSDHIFALDRDFKNYNDMNNAPNANSFKNSTHCRLKDIKNSNNTKFQGDKYVGYKDRAKTDTYGTGDGFGDLGSANSFMDDAWGVDSCTNSSSSIMARIQDDNGFKSIKEELYEGAYLGDDRDSRDNSVHSTHNIRSCTNAKSINSEDIAPRNYK